MRRPTDSTRYDILTSAEAWSLIGTLDADEFAIVQSEIEKIAWSAFSMRSTNSATTRLNVATPRLGMMFEIDHVARRVTVISLSRSTNGRNEVVIDEGEPKTSGGAGKKR